MERIIPTPEEVKQAIGTVAHALGRICTLRGFLPEAAPEYMSEHNRGGGPALDRALYDQPKQGELFGWDDMGNYYHGDQ